MTIVPAVPPEHSVSVKCRRCGDELPTQMIEWRHAEAHVAADRAMLRPSRRGSEDKNETAPLRLTVGL